MKHHQVQFIFFLVYLFLATILMIKLGVGITPDRYLLVLIFGSLFLHRVFKFLHDFIPFILVILAYDFLRGFAKDLNPHVHFEQGILGANLLLGGHLPTIELQKLFFTPGNLHWYDYGSSLLYLLHFAVPLALAFILWIYHRKGFLELSWGLTLVSYSALLFYLIYPTAPPWLAAKYGVIPPVTKIFNVALQNFPETYHLPTIYYYIKDNLVAALPSMHAAYAFLVFLYGVRYFKKWGLIFLPYFLLMWLGIIYLGEHYIIDIIFAAILTLIVFKLSLAVVKIYQH